MLDLSSQLSASRDIANVPVLDEGAFHLGKYHDGSVLKFRGVIRDVQDPEFVVLDHTAVALTDDEAMRKQLVERVPFLVTLFPHASDWTHIAYRAHKPTQSDGNQCEENACFATSKRSKRSMEDQLNCDLQQEKNDVHGKRSKAENTLKKEQNQAFLLLEAVHIYVYDGQHKNISLDAFKVNEAFEFVGILDLMIPGPQSQNGNVADNFNLNQLEELQLSDCINNMHRNDRSGVVLHCCHVSSLQILHHVRPHKSVAFYQQIGESNTSLTTFCQLEWNRLGYNMDILAMRLQLVEYLAQTVGGDTLTAEYLFLVLLSHVYARADLSTPLGNLSLNLFLNMSSIRVQTADFVNTMHMTLSSLMPMVGRVDLTINTLNTTTFVPYKDYECDVLRSGVLQVANGTTLLVNETRLSTGQLNEQGVKNIGALQSLMDKMVLPYDFQYYSKDFPQDVAVITLSEGKSIVPAIVSLPVVGTGNCTIFKRPTEELLECFRLFLCVLRSFNVTIGNEEAEMAEKHYVKCRKSKQNVSIDDLHRWLRLARLVALSRGEGRISSNSWDAMLQLETQRLSRLFINKAT